MEKVCINYCIPMQSKEIVEKSNKAYEEMFGYKPDEPYKSTDEHIKILLDKILEAIGQVGDAGGWYWGDAINVKIEVEYEPESK